MYALLKLAYPAPVEMNPELASNANRCYINQDLLQFSKLRSK